MEAAQRLSAIPHSDRSASRVHVESLDGQSRHFFDLLKRGDRDQAFGKINERYYGRLLVYARHKMGRRLQARYEASDLVAEAYRRALPRIDQFEYRGPGCFYRWMCRLISWVAAEWGRRQDGLEAFPPYSEIDEPTMAEVIDPHATPSSVVARVHLFERCARILESDDMPEIYRRVLVAIFLEAKSREEICDEWNIKPDTLRRQYSRALAMWREKLGGVDPESFL